MPENTHLYLIHVVRADGSTGLMDLYAESEAAAKADFSAHYPFTILGVTALS